MGDEMEIRPFTVCDYDMLMQWYRAHEIQPIEFTELPPTGFFVPGVAAGFMGKTDFQVAFAEGYVTNPEAREDDRNRALDLITISILQEADRLEFKKVYGMTKHGCIAERAERHGFKSIGHFELLAKEI